MYYKIENKECEVYKKLHELRTSELQIEEENKIAVREKVGLEFTEFMGKRGQQNFRRVTGFQGFRFLEPDKVDLKIWKRDTTVPELFVPNLRTVKGREMRDFLANGLKSSSFDRVFDAVGIEFFGGHFVFPYVEIKGEVIILFISNETPLDDNFIEITKKEFNDILHDGNPPVKN